MARKQPPIAIIDFDTAKRRAQQIKSTVAESAAAKALIGSHFFAGVTVNTLVTMADSLADKLGVSAKASALAASGFCLSHALVDMRLNQIAAAKFREELTAALNGGLTFSAEEQAQIDKLFDQTKMFPPQFYPYVLIVGTILFFGLDAASLFLPEVFEKLGMSGLTYGMAVLANVAAGSIFWGLGRKLAGVPALFFPIIAVANSATIPVGLVMGPLQKYLSYGAAAVPGVAAAVGAAATAFVGAPVMRYLTDCWERRRSPQAQGYVRVLDNEAGHPTADTSSAPAHS